MALVFRSLMNQNFNDATGNGFNGSAVGSPTSKPNEGINGAYSINVSNYVTIPYASSLGFASGVPFSFGIRVKHSSPGSVVSYYFQKGRNSASPSGYYHIYSEPNGTVTCRIWDGSGLNVTFSKNAQDGKWHEITVTRDSSNACCVYFDGVLVATGAAAVKAGQNVETLYLGYNPEDARTDTFQLDDAFVANHCIPAGVVKNVTAFNKGFI